MRHSLVLAPEAYAAPLDRLSCRGQHVRLQVYPHHLAGSEGLIARARVALPANYQRRSPAELFPRFLHRYRAALLPRLGDARPISCPFKQILF